MRGRTSCQGRSARSSRRWPSASGPDVIPTILDAGFNLDFIDDGVLAGGAKVDQGQLVIGQNRYRAIILPGVERIPPATLQRARVVRQTGRARRGHAPHAGPRAGPHGDGGGSCGTQGDSGPPVQRPPRQRACSSNARPIWRRRFARGMQPDVAVSAGASDIGFVHRRTEAADLYFVANTSNVRQSMDATFRVDASQAQQWHPMTGETTPIGVRTIGGPSRLPRSPSISRLTSPP